MWGEPGAKIGASGRQHGFGGFWFSCQKVKASESDRIRQVWCGGVGVTAPLTLCMTCGSLATRRAPGPLESRERICRRRGELLCAPGGAASPGLPRAAKSHQFVPLHARGTGHWTAAQRAVPRRHPPADPARPRPRAHAHAQRDRVYAAADRSARRRGWSGLRTRVRPNAARVARALATPHQHALQRLQPQQNSWM